MRCVTAASCRWRSAGPALHPRLAARARSRAAGRPRTSAGSWRVRRPGRAGRRCTRSSLPPSPRWRVGCIRTTRCGWARAGRLPGGQRRGRGAGAGAAGRGALARDVRGLALDRTARRCSAGGAGAQMVEAGLLDEVQGLLSRGYGAALPALQDRLPQFVEVAWAARRAQRARADAAGDGPVRQAAGDLVRREPDVSGRRGRAGGAEAVARATIEARVTREGLIE